MISDYASNLATELTEALRAELWAAEQERGLLARVALDELLRRVATREVFNARAAWLQKELRQALVSSEKHEREPLLREIHELAAELRRRQDANHILARKTLGFVRAYLSFLSPQPTAYDRRGQKRDEGSAPSTVSGRA